MEALLLPPTMVVGPHIEIQARVGIVAAVGKPLCSSTSARVRPLLRPFNILLTIVFHSQRLLSWNLCLEGSTRVSLALQEGAWTQVRNDPRGHAFTAGSCH